MAARDYIKIDRTNTAAIHSALLLSLIASVRHSYDLAKRVQGIIDHSNDAVVWTDVEALFGLPAGAGVTVSGLVAAAIRDVDAKALTERVG